MIIIEAVRTGCWNAITGQREVITVRECAEELLRGDATGPGYIVVPREAVERASVETVSPKAAATFRLRYPDADGLDKGERELLAHALTRSDDFRVCSCDKAAVRAAHTLGFLDRVVSLEIIADEVGARPNPGLHVQFTEKFLSDWRTRLRLGVAL